MALQEIREIQMQPVKLSTNTRRGLDISDLDHIRFALVGFKLVDYDARVHSDITARVSILEIHCFESLSKKKNYAMYKYTWPQS